MLDVLALVEAARDRLLLPDGPGQWPAPPDNLKVAGAMTDDAPYRGGPVVRLLPAGETYRPGPAPRVGAVQRATLRFRAIHSAAMRNSVGGNVDAGTLREARDFVRGRLAGWAPPGAQETLRLDRAETGLDGGRAWWADEYAVEVWAERVQSRVATMEE